MKIAAISIAAALVACGGLAHAADSSNDNGSQTNPQSSAAATPGTTKHSAGTVGAGKDAEGGSFTASDADKKKDLTKSK